MGLRYNQSVIMDLQFKIGYLRRLNLHICLLLGLSASCLSINWQSDNATCGRVFQSMTSLIVGGKPAADFAWPWQVAMFENGEQICGASLVDPSWVVTAAHCVTRCYLCEPERYTFRVGSNSLTIATTVTQVRKASRLFVHPDYSWDADDHDIALFKMAEPFEIDSNEYKVNTVCLPIFDMADQFTVGQEAIVTGWGTLTEDGDSPDVLYEATVQIMDQSQCNDSYGGEITQDMLCAGVPEGGVDSCQGDSGGPLVAFSDANPDQYYLIGVVSFGEGCGLKGYPGVYTRVTNYEDWLLPIFNGMILDTYVPCICNEGALSASVIIGLSFLSVFLSLSIAVNTFLFVKWWMARGTDKNNYPDRTS